MQNKSRKECIAIAKPHFKDGVQEVFVTSDGQPFYEENRAYLHKNSLGDKVTVYTVKADEVDITDSTNSKNGLLESSVTEIKKSVKEISDINFLQESIQVENAKSKPRTSVVKVLEARIAELSKDLPVNDSEEITNQNNKEE